jgi:hypothetical protein
VSVNDPLAAPPQGRMSTKATATIALIVVFFAGLVIGAAPDHAYLIVRGKIPMRRGASDRMVTRMVERLDADLHFTPAQRTTVTAILTRSRDRIDRIYDNIRPQVHAQIDATSGEIEKVLTPEQRTKFAEFRAKMEERRNHGRGPNDDPPSRPR